MTSVTNQTTDSYNLTILSPASNNENTSIKVDTKDKKIFIGLDLKSLEKKLVDSFDFEETLEIQIPERFQVEKLKYTISDGVIDILIPVDGRMVEIKPDTKGKK